MILTKTCKKCGEIKNRDQFYKGKTGKYGRRSKCITCMALERIEYKEEKALYDKKYYQENKEDMALKRIIYYEENKEAIVEYKAKHYIENRDQIIAKASAYYKDHKEEIAEYKTIHYLVNKEYIVAMAALWAKENIARANANKAKYRASKLRAAPSWLTEEHWKQIEKFYEEAAIVSKNTGIIYHVDHIIPLQGKEVSGLHVPWNLQLLPGAGPGGNCSKGNRINKLNVEE